MKDGNVTGKERAAWWASAAACLVIGFWAGRLGRVEIIDRDSIEDGRRSGAEDATAAVRSEALAAGAAHYVLIDEKTGETEFRWIVPASEPAAPNTTRPAHSCAPKPEETR